MMMNYDDDDDDDDDNDEIPERKRFIPKGFELVTTLS